MFITPCPATIRKHRDFSLLFVAGKALVIHMRELLRLDAVAEKIRHMLKKGNRAAKIIKSVTLAWTLFNILAAVWSLIPKEDSIPEVDADELLEAVTEAKSV